MAQLKRRSLPVWMPPDHTIGAIEAGAHWDALSLPQQVGLAALEHLDAETEHRPGPVVWDTHRADPQLYFLVPAGDRIPWPAGRLLTTGTWVGIPGASQIAPPGICWVCPPDPDEPDALVDADVLRVALGRVLSTAWAQYRPAGGTPRQVQVTSEQLHGRACISCGADNGPLVPAGHAQTMTGGAPLGWAVVACTDHMAVDR